MGEDAVLEHFGEPLQVTDERDFEYAVQGGEFSVVLDEEGRLSFIMCTAA